MPESSFSVIHQYCPEHRNETYKHRCHIDGIFHVTHKRANFFSLLRIFGYHFFFHQTGIEQMFCPKLYPVLYQHFIHLQHFYSEIHIQEEHSYKQSDDQRYKYCIHKTIICCPKVSIISELSEIGFLPLFRRLAYSYQYC